MSAGAAVVDAVETGLALVAGSPMLASAGTAAAASFSGPVLSGPGADPSRTGHAKTDRRTVTASTPATAMDQVCGRATGDRETADGI